MYRRNALRCLRAADDRVRDPALLAKEIEHTIIGCEEAERVLKALIAKAHTTIEESRALIAKIDEILAKRLQ